MRQPETVSNTRLKTRLLKIHVLHVQNATSYSVHQILYIQVEFQQLRKYLFLGARIGLHRSQQRKGAFPFHVSIQIFQYLFNSGLEKSGVEAIFKDLGIEKDVMDTSIKALDFPSSETRFETAIKAGPIPVTGVLCRTPRSKIRASRAGATFLSGPTNLGCLLYKLKDSKLFINVFGVNNIFKLLFPS